jgi:hypothetical protein
MQVQTYKYWRSYCTGTDAATASRPKKKTPGLCTRYIFFLHFLFLFFSAGRLLQDQHTLREYNIQKPSLLLALGPPEQGKQR